MAVNIDFEDVNGRKCSLSEGKILRETEAKTEDGVPAVALSIRYGIEFLVEYIQDKKHRDD